jgi:hypothetical protein
MKPFIFLFIVLLPLLIKAQQTVTLNGYVKDLYMFYHPEMDIPGVDSEFLSTNVVHNRLNFRWDATSKFVAVVEMRNRLIFGNLVSKFPEYASMVDVDNGFFDLSWLTAQNDKWFLHSMIDRAYLDYTAGKWQFRVGRQRINWGVNLVWNPNDVFNSFSYFDFDYEERPGSDAVRVQYYTGTTSSGELVYKAGNDADQTAVAGLYRFSRRGYDFQFIGGWVGPDLIAGGGWAGDIRGAGFRGEITRFMPRKGVANPVPATVVSVSGDYTFRNGWYIHGSVLYSSNGTTGKAGGMNLLFNPDMSAKQLSFARYSLFGQVSKPITPLLSGSFSGIVNPSDGSFYAGPSLVYSLQNNLELMLAGQLFFGSSGAEFGDIGQVAFGRLKWSF